MPDAQRRRRITPRSPAALIAVSALVALVASCEPGELTETIVTDPAFSMEGEVSVLEDAPPVTLGGWASELEAGGDGGFGADARFVLEVESGSELFAVAPSVSYPAGELSFTLAPDANGAAEVSARFEDGNGGVSPEGVFTIVVHPVNDAPGFTGADLELEEDAEYAGPWAEDITPGAPDEAEQALAFEVTGNSRPDLFTTQPAVSPDGQLTLDLAPDAVGTAELTVVLTDDGGTEAGGDDTSSPVPFTLTVTPVNDPPSFAAGADPSALEDAPAQRLEGWATALDPGPGESFGEDAAFVLTGNSSPALFTGDPAIEFPSGDLVFTPAPDAHGAAELAFELLDGHGGVSEPRTARVTVSAVNDAPSFDGEDVTVTEDSGEYSEAWATGATAGPPDEADQALEYAVTDNTHPELFATGPAVSSDGVLTFELAEDRHGAADITVLLTDDGGTSNGGIDASPPVTFTITVQPTNDPPSFTAGADPTLREDAGPQRLEGWAADIDAGLGESFGAGAGFAVTGNSNPTLFAGDPEIELPSGDLVFTSAPDAYGTADIVFELTDGHGGVSSAHTTTITVRSVNDAPTFTPGADVTVVEGAGPYEEAWATGITAGAANEAGQLLSFQVVTVTNTALFSAGPAIAADGELSFETAPAASGSSEVTIQLLDDGGRANGGDHSSAQSTFTIAVTPVNDPPSFTAGADPSVREDAGAQRLAGWATALDAGPGESFGGSAGFALTSSSNPALFTGDPEIDFPSGDLVFTPAPDAHGTADLTLELADGHGGVSAAHGTTITVRPVNDAPGFTPGADVTVQEDAGPYEEPWATGITTGAANEASQSLSFQIVTVTSAALFSAGPALAADGELSFETAPGAHGSSDVTIRLTDDGGTSDGGDDTSPDATFTITVTPVNDPPSFTAGTDPTVLEDAGTQVISAWAEGIDAGPGESFGAGAGFVFSGNTNAALFAVQPAVDLASGDLTFEPAADAHGTAELELALEDGDGAVSPSTTVRFTVQPVNDAPVITAYLPYRPVPKVGDTVSSPRTASATFDFLVPRDRDTITIPGLIDAVPGPASESGQTLTLSADGVEIVGASFSSPSGGDLVLDLAPGAWGSTVLEIGATDSGGTDNGGTDTATLPLRILRNPGPVAEDRHLMGRENQRCIALSLRGTAHEGMWDVDGVNSVKPMWRFLSLPARGTLMTPDLGTPVQVSVIYPQKEFCFVPDRYTHSDSEIVDGELIHDVYAEMTYEAIDDLGDASAPATVDIIVEGIF